LGAGALARADGAAVLKAAAGVAKTFGMTWNVLHSAASRVGGLDLGFVPGEGGKTAAQLAAKGGADVLFLLGADEIDLSASKAFTVYLGTHGDRGAHRADVILPGAAYTEKNGIYVNTEGRVQLGVRAVFPKGEAKEGLVDSARALRTAGGEAALRQPRPVARQAVRRAPDVRTASTMWRDRRPRRRWTLARSAARGLSVMRRSPPP
jgi:NADH dehydrogenase/NADH:ubiquinone oxidoreductase subunit G